MAEVFVRATGQAENLGDSVLRRPLIEALRPLGKVNVLVRQLPDQYVSGLGLTDADELYRDEAVWRSEALRSARNGRMVFAFNAGEIQFNRFYATSYARVLPLIRAARRSGGFGVHLGVGVRNSASRWGLLLRPTIAACEFAAWREDVTPRVMRPREVMPDWAFVTGASNEVIEGLDLRERSALAVTFRGDRAPLTKADADLITAVARANDLRLQVYAQVARDSEPMRLLAARLDAEFVEVPMAASHEQQEIAVRRLLRDSAAIISDRLHALIMGATEGAVPLVIGEGRSAKAASHFRAAGVPLIDLAALTETPHTLAESGVGGYVVRAREDVQRRVAEMTKAGTT